MLALCELFGGIVPEQKILRSLRGKASMKLTSICDSDRAPCNRFVRRRTPAAWFSFMPNRASLLGRFRSEAVQPGRNAGLCGIMLGQRSSRHIVCCANSLAEGIVIDLSKYLSAGC